MNLYARLSFTQLMVLSVKRSKFDLEKKTYVRWSHRKPIKVLPDERLENNISREREEIYKTESENYVKNVKTQKQLKGNNLNNTKAMKLTQKLTTKKSPTTDMLQTVIDSNGEIVYTKVANHDSRISILLTTVKSKKEQLKNKVILLEGKRLIKEALENGCRLQNLLFSQKQELEYLKSYLPKSGANIYKMPYREMQLWSDLSTCPGIMAVFQKPDVENYTPTKYSIQVTVVCDNIREPGNLGGILRTCAAAGCEKVLLTKGCVNLWDTKVTRGGSGAHFRLQIHSKLEWSNIHHHLSANSKLYIADNKIITATQNPNDIMDIQDIPLIPYYGLHFSATDAIVLVIGGETEGVSIEAYQLLQSYQGARLNVPLVNGFDSLNSGVALGVVIFEIKRQLMVFNSDKEKLEVNSVG